jgi:outer membrane murein-binding lipoprotein Lpp
MGAEQVSAEMSMEARIAHLESDVGHLRTDVADIKIDLRSLRDKVDAMGIQLNAKFDTKIDSLRSELNVRIDEVAKDLGAKTDALQDSLASTRVWALLLYFALAAGVFSTMARGFGWL